MEKIKKAVKDIRWWLFWRAVYSPKSFLLSTYAIIFAMAIGSIAWALKVNSMAIGLGAILINLGVVIIIPASVVVSLAVAVEDVDKNKASEMEVMGVFIVLGLIAIVSIGTIIASGVMSDPSSGTWDICESERPTYVSNGWVSWDQMSEYRDRYFDCRTRKVVSDQLTICDGFFNSPICTISYYGGHVFFPNLGKKMVIKPGETQTITVRSHIWPYDDRNFHVTIRNNGDFTEFLVKHGKIGR